MGGNLRIATYTEETSLLPLQTTWDSVGFSYGMAMMDPLLISTATGQLLPYLAQSVTHNPDYTQWTITTRPNIKYHDGSPLDAANLVANLEALKASPVLGFIFSPIESVKASGSQSVVLTMSTPWVPFPAYLTLLWPQATTTLPQAYKGKPIGTGPFVYKDWQPGNHLTVTRNPNYWRRGLPYLDQVTFMTMTSSPQKENALRAGSIDVAQVGNTIDNMKALASSSSLQYVDDSKSVGPSLVYWLLNCSVAPTNDVRVRNALAYATDQPTFWKDYFDGSGAAGGLKSTTPVTGPFEPGSSFYELDTGYPQKQDLNKAKSLIASYTKEHGKPRLTLTVTNDPKEVTGAALAQSMWQQAGIDVTIQQVDVATLIVRALKGQTQAVFWDYGAAADPDENVPAWSPAFAAPIGTIALEETRLKDSRIDPLLNKGRTSPVLADRITAYKALARVFGELTPFIYMGRSLGGIAAGPKVGNLTSFTAPDGTSLPWFSSPGTIATEMWLG